MDRPRIEGRRAKLTSILLVILRSKEQEQEAKHFQHVVSGQAPVVVLSASWDDRVQKLFVLAYNGAMWPRERTENDLGDIGLFFIRSTRHFSHPSPRSAE